MYRYLLTGLIIASCAAIHAESNFEPGTHYEVITPAQPTKTGDKIEVIEFFWYGCQHCFTLEPHIKAWMGSKAPYIEFMRIPAVFADNWEIHARTYYAAQKLGVLDTIHTPLFEALHLRKRPLFTEDALATFFAELGIGENQFRQAFNSFAVDTKTRQAISATWDYGVDGVPTMITNGKYRSSARRAGSYEELLNVVNYLAAKEHKSGVEE